MNYKRNDDLIRCYIHLAKNIIYRAAFSSKEEDRENFETIVKLQKTLKQNKLPVVSIDILLEKLQANDLDFIINDALEDKEFALSFLEKIRADKFEIEINDLASRLGYTVDITKKLIQKCMQEKRVEGYLTLDKQKFISKYYLTKLLYEKIKEGN